MEAMRKSWTDERLDDFRGEVTRRFDEVDRRFDEVDRRFGEVDRRFDGLEGRMERGFGKCEIEFHRINDRLDDLVRVMILGVIAMTSAMIAGLAAIATQL